MEAKLKSQRVADLRELLQKASVAIPAKANKADLIAKILSSPAAIEVYNSGNPTTSAAPVPKPKAPESIHAAPDDDLLAPPEEFDWGPSNGDQAASDVPAESAAKAVSNSTTKPTTTAKESGAEQSIKKPATTSAGVNAENLKDDEFEKRRKRAARFGIPLVEAKPKGGPTSNGTKAARDAPKAQNISTEEAAKIEARAARFGIPTTAPGASNASTATAVTSTTASPGRKRPRSPVPVDDEEIARRRKRAERFASGGEVKAQT